MKMELRLALKQASKILTNNMKQEDIPCFDCDGTLKVEYQTFNEKVDDRIYVVENVPVHKCDCCGSEVLSAAALHYIEEQLPPRPRRGPRRIKD